MIATDSSVENMGADAFAIVQGAFTPPGSITSLVSWKLPYKIGRNVRLCAAMPAESMPPAMCWLWPEAATILRQPPLPEILTALLGPDAGLVRSLLVSPRHSPANSDGKQRG